MEWKLNIRYQSKNRCRVGRRLTDLKRSHCRGRMRQRADAAVTEMLL
jgi:hypothetical protein